MRLANGNPGHRFYLGTESDNKMTIKTGFFRNSSSLKEINYEAFTRFERMDG